MILFYEPDSVLKSLDQYNLRDAYNKKKQRLQQFPRFDFEHGSATTRNGNRLLELRRDENIAFRLHSQVIGKMECDILELLRVFPMDFHGEQLEIQLGKLSSKLSEEELMSWAKAELTKVNQAPQENTITRDPLPPELLKWFNIERWQTAGAQDPLGLTVYETKRWRENIREALKTSRLSEIHRELSRFYFDEQDSYEQDNQKPDQKKTHIERDQDYYQLDVGDWGILCHYRKEPKADLRKLTLIAIYLGNGDKKQWACEVKRLYENHDAAMYPLPKAYPGILLCRENAENAGNGGSYNKWLETEKEGTTANLAMSGEEMDILYRLTGGEMPFFINGPAGSGKSTILHYLFVHFWKHKIDNNLPGDLLFITLSETLLSKAKAVVKEILNLELSCLPDTKHGLQEEERLESSFCAFREILRKIIGPDVATAYPPGREIDFEAFKELFHPPKDKPRFDTRFYYLGKHHKEISAELCWHIIRSYIKGYSADGQMTPEQFGQLRQQGVFVSQEDYRTVYEEVWPWYDRLTASGRSAADRYWDQQDLARKVLNNLIVSPVTSWPEGLRNVAAIFCDEAQDFTGVELNIVQRLSMLTRYDLKYQRMMPFAFAGDPMQSLNPSGFRWEDLRASMYRNLVQEKNSNCQVWIESLHLNYRSPKEITYLANQIQLVRGYIFRESMRAQTPQSSDAGTPPMLYLFDKEKTRLSPEELKHLSGSIILLPCSAGHEDKLIGNYPILKQIKDNDPNQQFMSVMTAKGLDIQKVIVFAFGEKLFPQKLDLNASEDIARAYAFNQVYVAVTRATSQLMIMETHSGYEHLWKVLDEDETRVKCLADAAISDERRAEWKTNLSQLKLRQSGMSGFVDMNDDQIRKQAEDFEAGARDTQDSELMSRAELWYRQAGDNDKALYCRALSNKYKGDFEAAANLLRDRADVNRAELVDCLWQGRMWKELCDPKLSVAAGKRAVAQFMKDKTVTLKAVTDFLSKTDEVSQLPLGGFWQEELFSRLCDFALAQQTLMPTQKMDMASLSEYLLRNQHAAPSVQKAIGHLCVLLNEWEKARRLDLPRESLSGDDLLQINAHIAPWPDYILDCWKLKERGGRECFAQRWRKNDFTDASLDDEKRDAAIQLFIDNGMNREALDFVVKHRYAKAWQLFKRHDNFSIEMAILKIILNDPYPDWGLCKKVLSNVSHLMCQADNIRELLDLIAKVSSSRKISTDSKQEFDAILLDICKSHCDWFESKDDFTRAAAAFEKIGLGKNLSELGEFLIQYYKSDLAKRDIAASIYTRGRRITAEYEGAKNPGGEVLASYRNGSAIKLSSWGYPPEQIDLLWKNASKEFLRPSYTPTGESSLERIDCSSEGEWKKDPLRVEIHREEIDIYHKSVLRYCLLFIEKKDPQEVILAGDRHIRLEIGKEQLIPLGNNSDEVKLVLQEKSVIQIKHRSWQAACELRLSDYWD